jgi:hypothetical protein
MSYALSGYSTFSYSGSPSFAAFFIMGASLAATPGSNLIAPMPVGRYGAWNFSTTITKNTSKAIPVRVGKSYGWVSFSTQTRATAGVGGGLPAYGN